MIRTLAGPPRCRSSFSARSRARFRRAGVTSTLRPVHSTAMIPPSDRTSNESETLFSLRRGWDAELLAVLRHGPPGDLDSLRAELLHDPRVGVRALRVLVGDDLRDLALDREG